jgi:hypothetical protein
MDHPLRWGSQVEGAEPLRPEVAALPILVAQQHLRTDRCWEQPALLLHLS